MYGAVYQIRNKVNGKRYIGQSIDPKHRRSAHFCRSAHRTNPILRKAMAKYGKENFSFKIIDIAESKEELDRKEIYWIEKRNAMVPNGYNIREGGSRGRLSEATKKKISRIHKRKGTFRGENNPCYGRVGLLNPMYGKVGPNKGKKLTEKQKKLLSKRMTGLKRSDENKKNSRAASLRRWKESRERHFEEKGHEYDVVTRSNGEIKCRICKNENQRRRYREIQKAQAKEESAKKKSRKEKVGN